MANLRISQLNSYTGGSEDLRWFVMNNSGETETFKFSGFTSPLRFGTSANSIMANYLTSFPAGERDILIGNGATIPSTGNDNVILGGVNSTIRGGATRGAIISTNTGDIFGGLDCAILGGASNVIDSSQNCAIVGGVSNYANGVRLGFLGGFSNDFGNCGDSGMVGGSNHSSWANNTFHGGGDSNIIASSAASASNSAFIGGTNNSIGSGSNRSVIIGGTDNTTSTSPRSSIIGGSGNTMNEMSNGTIVGGSGNMISGSSNFDSSIIASSASTINSTASRNVIINSVSTIITGSTTGAVMIGTDSRTADDDNTTYVENLRAFGQYYSNGSSQTGSTITVDFNEGNIHFIEVTGNLTLTLNNVKNGGRYVIITSTTGNYSISSKTASGFTFKTDSGFDTLGNTKVHRLALDVIGNVIYGTHTADLT